MWKIRLVSVESGDLMASAERGQGSYVGTPHTPSPTQGYRQNWATRDDKTRLEGPDQLGIDVHSGRESAKVALIGALSSVRCAPPRAMSAHDPRGSTDGEHSGAYAVRGGSGSSDASTGTPGLIVLGSQVVSALLFRREGRLRTFFPSLALALMNSSILRRLAAKSWKDKSRLWAIASASVPTLRPLSLIAAGDNPERLHSEAAWAHLCGVAPIPAGSGKTNGRVRHHQGGDRQANSALWRIVMVRIAHDPDTRLYFERRVKEGRTKHEVIRILKRYVAREVYRYLPRG